MPSSWFCWRHFCAAVLVLVSIVSTLGCNAFEDVQPAPSTVEALLADARTAMTKGNHQRAVRLLETAFERDSTHIEVRIELASALYSVKGLDAFTVRAAIEHMNGKGASVASETAVGDICTSEPDSVGIADRLRGISFKDDAIQSLVEERETLQRVSQLVIQGGLQGRADAFAREAAEVRAKGYHLAALTRLSLRLEAVKEAVRGAKGTLFVVSDGVTPAFIVCGEALNAVSRIERALCREQRGAVQAVSWLQARNDLIGSEQTALLIDLLETHIGALRTRLSCSSTTPS